MTTLASAPPLADLYRRARSLFPALAQVRPPTVFLDNAGGSQMPGVVAQAIYDYMLQSYVQLGADYEVSRRATRTVARAHELLKTFMNVPDGDGPRGGRRGGEVILGASTSELCNRLAAAYGDAMPQGSEIIVCETGHESNIGPWVRLERRGMVVKHWRVDPRTGDAPLHGERGLEALLTDRTRIVAFPQVSNILGKVIEPRPIVDLVRGRSPQARIVCDGVAFAPHRAIDVAAWGVDYYVYSTYKVFGPHMAALYGSREALAEVTGPNHYFIAGDELPRKFELGGVSHEGAAGIVALDHFLRDLIGRERMTDPAGGDEPFERAVVEDAFALMERLELPLQEQLVAYLRGKPGVRIIGPDAGDRSRICTIAFTREGRPSREIARAANEQGLGIRYGHFYAYRLCKALGLVPEDGVVRVSLAHYNTPEEVDRLCDVLDKVL
jgi:cysteine desulfurase family protein (TIGR01976 family)